METGGYTGGPCLQARHEARGRAVTVEENLILLFVTGKSNSLPSNKFNAISCFKHPFSPVTF